MNLKEFRKIDKEMEENWNKFHIVTMKNGDVYKDVIRNASFGSTYKYGFQIGADMGCSVKMLDIREIESIVLQPEKIAEVDKMAKEAMEARGMDREAVINAIYRILITDGVVDMTADSDVLRKKIGRNDLGVWDIIKELLDQGKIIGVDSTDLENANITSTWPVKYFQLSECEMDRLIFDGDPLNLDLIIDMKLDIVAYRWESLREEFNNRWWTLDTSKHDARIEQIKDKRELIKAYEDCIELIDKKAKDTMQSYYDREAWWEYHTKNSKVL